MDKNERASRRARNAMVQLLVTLEQPTTDEEALSSIHAWESKSYPDLVKTVNYNIQRNHYINAGQLWYLNLCMQEVERVRQEQTKVLETANT